MNISVLSKNRGWSLLEVMMAAVIGIGLLLVISLHYHARVQQVQTMQDRLILFEKNMYLEQLIRNQVAHAGHLPCGEWHAMSIHIPKQSPFQGNAKHRMRVEDSQGQKQLVIDGIGKIEAQIDSLVSLSDAHIHFIQADSKNMPTLSEKQWVWVSDCEFGEWIQVKSIKKIKQGFSVRFENELQHAFSNMAWIAPFEEIHLLLNQGELYIQVNGGARMSIFQGLKNWNIQFWVASAKGLVRVNSKDIQSRDSIAGLSLIFELEENHSVFDGVIHASVD